MKHVKIAEAPNRAIDWLVALSLSQKDFDELRNGRDFSPTTDPAQAWPIIERIGGFELKIWLESKPETRCEAHIHNLQGDWIAFGPTSLIAAMRCYCASVYGEEAEVPDELV